MNARSLTAAELDAQFDARCKAIGDGIERLQRTVALYELALEKIAGAEGCQPGHVAYLSKTAMSALADRVLQVVARGEQ